MKLNALNAYIKDNKIQCNEHGFPMFFFPIKWQIDWTFNSGAEDPDYAAYLLPVKLTFSFNNVGARPNWQSGYIFAGSVQDEHSVTSCTYERTTSQNSIEVALTQTADTDSFSANGTLVLVADFFPDAQSQDPIAELEAITEFKGDVLTFIPLDVGNRFPDAQFTHNITMLRGDQ